MTDHVFAIQSWLEWAGARLIAMPEPRIKPAEPRVIWPDYAQDSHEVTTFRGKLSLRAAAPAKDEVAMVDKILLLPNICSLPNVRRVLQVRALVHPINYRHLYSWARISKLLHTSNYQVKSWHQKGLIEVASKTPKSTLCEIKSFMEERLS
jgi:hypothetical protein